MKRLLLLCALTACGRDITAPAATIPASATRVTPGAFEQLALDSARACITRNGSKPDPNVTVDGIAWYAMPGASFAMPSGAIYEGYSVPGWIVRASGAKDWLLLTEHELAHQLVLEVIPHSSAFWVPCGWMSTGSVGTTFTIPSP